jgi:hypothetical protein
MINRVDKVFNECRILFEYESSIQGLVFLFSGHTTKKTGTVRLWRGNTPDGEASLLRALKLLTRPLFYCPEGQKGRFVMRAQTSNETTVLPPRIKVTPQIKKEVRVLLEDHPELTLEEVAQYIHNYTKLDITDSIFEHLLNVKG